MRIAVFGAGGVGGRFGAQLALAGHDVTFIARGAHLAAIQRDGLKLLIGGEDRLCRPQATDDPETLGAQDYVIVCLKAHQAWEAAERIRPLLKPGTAVVTGQNGVPWWYTHGLRGRFSDARLSSVDPGDRQWTAIGPDRAIGCVVYPATEITEPGVIRHVEGHRFSLGEPDESRSERCGEISRAFRAGGLRAPVATDLRSQIWLKVIGNAALNPVTALLGATLGQLGDSPAAVRLVRAVMTECASVASALGVVLPVSVDQRLAGAIAVGDHRTSMLQDRLAGRPLEIDCLTGAVIEIAARAGVDVPQTRAVHDLVTALGDVG